jgi:hypothetical protein
METSRLEDQIGKAAEQEDLKGSKLRMGRLSPNQLKRLSKAVMKFSANLCNVTLHPYQEEFCYRMIYSLVSADGEEITGLFSRQSGKTESVTVVVDGCMVMLPLFAKYVDDPRIKKFAAGLWVGIFAPSYEQAGTMHSRMILRMHSQHARMILKDKDIGIDLNDKRQRASLQLPQGSFVDCNSAAKQSKIEGKSYHLIVLEESQDIDPYIYRKSISPMGAYYKASQVKIGTPNMLRSDFYDACQRNAHRDVTVSDNALRNHYQYDYQVAAKYNPNYAEYVEKEKDRLGFDSDEFRMAYRLHWILERGMFVEPTHFEMLGGNYYVCSYDVNNPMVAGIDVGKVAAATVITIVQPDYNRMQQMAEGDLRCHKKIQNWLELKGDNYVSQFAQMKDFLGYYRSLNRICIDATGVGQPLYDMLVDHYEEKVNAGKMQIIPFEASLQSNHEGYLRLLQDLQNSRIEYPNSDKAKKLAKQRTFVQQVLNMQKTYHGAYLQVAAIDEKLQKDYFSSLMLACYGCDTQEFNAEVVETANFLMGRGAGRGLASDTRRSLWK